MPKRCKTAGKIQAVSFVPLVDGEIPDIGQEKFESVESFKKRQEENKGLVQELTKKLICQFGR